MAQDVAQGEAIDEWQAEFGQHERRYAHERLRQRVAAIARLDDVLSSEHAIAIQGPRLRVLIRERECVDSMSGERAESSVAVEIDGYAYRGCGYALP